MVNTNFLYNEEKIPHLFFYSPTYLISQGLIIF